MKQNDFLEYYSIDFQSLDVFPEKRVKNKYFELIFILSGSGQHCINQHKFKYGENHMFLLTPQDCNKFLIETTTSFFFLRFSNSHLQHHGISNDSIQRLKFILQNANHKPGCILQNQMDKQLVRPIVEALIRETTFKDVHHSEIKAQLINTLIVVVARNICKYLPQRIDQTSDERIVAIINYIQSNIYEPEKVRTEHICLVFNISENYLGKYFKKHTGETLKSYINYQRVAVVEHRLKHSDLRITEIASELGFTDESHLNKFFKAQRGKSPKAFREEFACPVTRKHIPSAAPAS